MKRHSIRDSISSILIIKNDRNSDANISSWPGNRKYQIEVACTLHEGLSKVHQKGFDTILLDGDSMETQTFPTLQSLIGIAPWLPIIIIGTPHDGSNHRGEFLRRGAFDYVNRLNLREELPMILERALEVKNLRMETTSVFRKLHMSEKKFKSVVQAAPDAIVLSDGKGNILSWNQAAQTMFGYPAADIIGKPLTLLMPSRYHQAHQQGLKRVRTKGDTRVIGHIVELTGLRKNGVEFPIELSLSYSLSNREIIYCGIIRDITERKEAALELVDRNRMLKLDAEVGQIIGRCQDMRSLLQACSETLVRHLDAALARIWILDQKTQILRLQASAGISTNLEGAYSRITIGHFKIGRIAAEKKPMATNSIIGDPRISDQDWARREGLIAFAGYPLLREQREVVGGHGVICPPPFNDLYTDRIGIGGRSNFCSC